MPIVVRAVDITPPELYAVIIGTIFMNECIYGRLRTGAATVEKYGRMVVFRG